MKTVLSSLLVLFWLSGWSQTTIQNQRLRNQAIDSQFERTRSLVESNQFKITINRILPINGINTDEFDPRGVITINGSTANGDIPYFGRSNTATPGKSVALKFNDTMKNRSFQANDNNNTLLYQFSIRADDFETYTFSIDVTANGATTINMSSDNQPTITYYGELTASDN